MLEASRAFNQAEMLLSAADYAVVPYEEDRALQAASAIGGSTRLEKTTDSS